MMKKISVFLAALIVILLPVSSSCFEIPLAWDPNTEEDLAGYRVYTGLSPTGPWEFVGEVTKPSPELPPPTNFSWPIPPNIDATIYFAVTAFDDAIPPNESGKSDSVNEDIDNIDPALPVGLRIINMGGGAAVIVIPSTK